MKENKDHSGSDSKKDERIPLVMPDFMVDQPIKLSLWLVSCGERVLYGDRIAEILVGAATFDLEAPISGRLMCQNVEEDDVVATGMILAEFAPLED
ncbi:MAG: hypothetical protein ABGW78_04995 [Pirellulales bacterium]